MTVTWPEYGVRLHDGTVAPASGLLVAWRHAAGINAQPVVRAVDMDPAAAGGTADYSTSPWQPFGAAA